MVDTVHLFTGETLTERYIDYLVAGGRAERTIVTRRRQVKAIVDAVDPYTATMPDLLPIIGHPNWRPATRASQRAAVRSFFRWLKDTGLRDDDPSERLPTVHMPPPTPHPASEAALDRARRTAKGPHERVMVELAARAGLRRAEIAGLKFSNLICEADGQYVLRVTGKGGRTRVVPIPADLAEMIEDLKVDWVLPSRFAGKHMSPNWVGQRLSDLLGPSASAHHLRHRYATRIYGSTHDLLAVQALLGHSSPATTQVYVRQSMDDLRAAAAAAS